MSTSSTTPTPDAPQSATAPEAGASNASFALQFRRCAKLGMYAVRDGFVGLWALLVACFCLLGIGIYLAPAALSRVRTDADQARRAAWEFSGVEIPAIYRKIPPLQLNGASNAAPATRGRPAQPESGHNAVANALSRWRYVIAIMRDPMTPRDLMWHLGNPFVGAFVAWLPVVLLLNALWGPITLALSRLGDWDEYSWYTFVPLSTDRAPVYVAALVILQLVAVFPLTRWGINASARWAAHMLTMPPEAQLEARVAQLSHSRQDAVEMQAAELRRIERDLHDGAQARLVAMGMDLSAAEQVLESNPEEARRILTAAKDNSSLALQEIRNLVRGIHPPVLADRGLEQALRALAAEAPIDTVVLSGLSVRLIDPLESALYFAVSECMTNASKHSGAKRIDVQVTEMAAQVIINVRDDGVGGAAEHSGGGLQGVARRLAAFDGELTVASPAGGPTTLTMVVPKVQHA
jgi:signal transduction histidine kinase